MKSQINVMLEVWEAVLLDAASSCAINMCEIRKDLARAKTSSSTRGLGFFTLDLPNLDDCLLRLLETGRHSSKGHLSGRKSKADSRPRFLYAFWSLVMDADGLLYDNADTCAISAIRQISTFFKKLEVPCSPLRINNSVQEYHDVEHALEAPALSWAGDDIDSDAACSFTSSFGMRLDWQCQLGAFDRTTAFLTRLDRVSRILISELGEFNSYLDDEDDVRSYRHGPGAVSNLRGSEYKYSFPTWSDKLDRVFPFDWVSGSPIGTIATKAIEPASKLIHVPKTAKAPRLIASEPVEHQWCQQKILRWIDKRMKNTLIGRFINLHDQSLSQRMVTSASQDRSLSTIDLSAASDRVTCRHVEALLSVNPALLQAVHACRTRRLRDPILTGNTIALRKFASMGSALTFPIQSIFFLAIVLASCDADTPKKIRALTGKVRIFGDDIIMPNSAHESCVSYLQFLGLKVNDRKSFYQGFFRESCGMDAYKGVDVTPLKPKHAPSGTLARLQSTLDTSNNLYRRGYWRTAALYQSYLPKRFQKNVFSVERAGVPGLISFMGDKVRTKYDRNLHKWYVPQPHYYEAACTDSQDNSFSLREFLTRPFSAEMPRTLGLKRRAVAKVATARVDVFTSRVILFK